MPFASLPALPSLTCTTALPSHAYTIASPSLTYTTALPSLTYTTDHRIELRLPATLHSLELRSTAPVKTN